MRTFQGRPSLSTVDAAALDAYGDLFGRTLRTLHARRAAKQRDDKPGMMREFGLPARQFNAVRVSLDGMHALFRERLPELVDDVARRLKSTKRRSARAEDPAERHHLARRAFRLTTRLARLRADAQAGTIRIAFGSKRLFRAQNDLAGNGYAGHEAWLEAWRTARSKTFFVLGSRDESRGNQGCSATALGSGIFRLRLRLPNRLVADYGKYVVTTVQIAYGAAHIEHALAMKQAISYRFKRDEKGWRVFISTAEIAVEQASDRRTGTLGVDLNADHLALALTDRFGNLIASERVAMVTYGCSAEQAAAKIGDAVRHAVAVAVSARVPLVIERLDFSKKKAAMREQGARYARMLSALSYSRIKQTICARAHDAGIAVLPMNPAYTSVIGRQKFSRRYGISGHMGAALAVARRARGFSERVSRHGQVAFDVPVRTRQKHVWSSWALIAKRERAEHAARRQSQRTKRGDPPNASTATSPATASGATYLSSTGGIPVRESVTSTVRVTSVA